MTIVLSDANTNSRWGLFLMGYIPYSDYGAVQNPEGQPEGQEQGQGGGKRACSGGGGSPAAAGCGGGPADRIQGCKKGAAGWVQQAMGWAGQRGWISTSKVAMMVKRASIKVVEGPQEEVVCLVGNSTGYMLAAGNRLSNRPQA